MFGTERLQASVNIMILCGPPLAVLHLEDVMLGVMHHWRRVRIGLAALLPRVSAS